MRVGSFFLDKPGGELSGRASRLHREGRGFETLTAHCFHFGFWICDFGFFSRSSAIGKIIFSHSAYSLAEGCKPSGPTNDGSLPIFLLSSKTSTTLRPRFFASSLMISLKRVSPSEMLRPRA